MTSLIDPQLYKVIISLNYLFLGQVYEAKS